VTNTGPAQKITGTWKIEFFEGEPQFSKSVEVSELKSLTSFDVTELKSFCGAGRYTISFEAPGAKADDWMLDLGKVCRKIRLLLGWRRNR